MSVATDMGVSVKTVAKWVRRYQAEGEAGLLDRSSRPHRLRLPTPPDIVGQIETLRRRRIPGDQIAGTLGVSAATVSRVLRRLGLSRIKDLEPAEPVRRYQREHPGELIHIDIKKLGRFHKVGHRITGDWARRTDLDGRSARSGWEYVHVCIDDASRIAFSQILPNERKESAVAFLEAAVAYYAGLGVAVTRVMTDNGSCYRSRAFRQACKALGLKHIRTSLREWAYAQAYPTSEHRKAELPRWLHQYNWHRPHGSLQSQTPISRLGLDANNLLRLHS
jgi:transposase InsO family protein